MNSIKDSIYDLRSISRYMTPYINDAEGITTWTIVTTDIYISVPIPDERIILNAVTNR